MLVSRQMQMMELVNKKDYTYTHTHTPLHICIVFVVNQ